MTPMRAAFARGLAEQAIGAEYVAHYLAGMVMTPRPIEGDRAGHPTSRSSFLGHPGGSVSSGDDQLSLDLPSAPANPAPRGGRVQAAAGAPHRGRGAKRSAWTRLSTALPFDADGGH